MEGISTRDEINAEIAALKSLLAATDYQALKHADGALSDDEYSLTKAKRQGWRDSINSLEAQLALLADEDTPEE